MVAVFNFNLARAVFEPTGIKVKTKIVPYARSVFLVENTQADAWVGSFLDEQLSPLYPNGILTVIARSPWR